MNLSGNELTSNLSGNIRPQSPLLAEPLWTDPGIKSGISVRELITVAYVRARTLPLQLYRSDFHQHTAAFLAYAATQSVQFWR